MACLLDYARIEDAFLSTGMKKHLSMSAKNTLRTPSERAREIVCLLTEIRSITIHYRPIGHINAFPTLTATVITITCNNDDSAYDNNIVVCDPGWTVLRYSVGRCRIRTAAVHAWAFSCTLHQAHPGFDFYSVFYYYYYSIIFFSIPFDVYLSTVRRRRAQEECRITKLSLMHIISSQTIRCTRGRRPSSACVYELLFTPVSRARIEVKRRLRAK